MIKNKSELFALMQNKLAVITPNNRLSTELIKDFFRANPKQIQDKPLCLPYSAFLQRCFKKLFQDKSLRHPLVLTKQQTRYLWSKVLALSTKEYINEGLIQAVEEAWTRCHLWQIDFNHPSFSHNPQTKQFQRWSLALEQELHHLGAITEDQLATYLLSQKHQDHYQGLIWACFDEYTPQQRALQDFFKDHDCSSIHYDLKEPTANPHFFAANDGQDEYQQLIHWLNERLSQNEKRIAVVIPQLQSEAHPLKRLLHQQLTAAFNISLGESLADYPLVAHALCWLELDGEHLFAYQGELLLHSPYLGDANTEMLARAQCRETSKCLQESQFPKQNFIQELIRSAPKLAKLLKNLMDYPEKDSILGWIHQFKNRLKTLGFPGEYALNSASYQCFQRFLTLFEDFKQLALLSKEMTKSEAIAALKQLAKSTIFQPKKPKAAIQILGFLEVAGCQFDSLWVTGLSDQCLPQKVRPSAFIPISLQRDKQMPYACPERELRLARKALTRLALSAQHVVFSYPQLTEDKPNLPSSLIIGFAPYSPLERSKNKQPSYLVNVEESYELPLDSEEEVSGGTAILANQAKCPFRAFAIHRLNAKPPPTLSEGPDAMERGQLIHKVMELIWQTLKNQQTLLSLDENRLDAVIEEAILTALEPLIQQRSYSFSPLIQEVELSKLKRLVHSCLNWERQRPSFEIEALEQAFNINLAGIDFKVRVDRLDKLEDGNKWVIDYKSSLPTSLPWKEERPKEPQLLLYALLDETINGLLFAQLKAGQLSCKGLSADSQTLGGLTSIKKGETWTDYREHWQAQLNELAQEFSQGQCHPKPAHASICQRCELQGLCRFEASTDSP